ncbi:MAG: RND family transporter, partial [Nitrospinaceae bacterium]
MDWSRVIHWRWGMILLVLAVAGSAASGGRFLGFSTDYRVFFSKDNPQLVAFETLQNTYTKNDNILIGIEPADGRVFSRETLRAVREITEASWQIPYSIRVDSVTNFQYTWAEGDDLVVQDLVPDPEAMSDADLERVRDVALAEPLLANRLVNPAAAMTGVNVTINLPGKHNGETPEVTAFVRRLADRFRAEYPGIKFYLTGVVFMDNAFNEAGVGDMTTLVPVMYSLVIVILWWVLGSFFAMLATVLVIAFSVATAMGLAGWLGIMLTPISANGPTIILTLGVADSIHILTTFLHEMRMGRTKGEALAESLRVNQGPVFITSITTAIGFLSLNFSDSPPFRDLGNIVAMGVMAAYVYSITLLPALMSLLPVKVRPLDASGRLPVDRIADFVIANRRRLFFGMLGLMAVLV